MLKSTQAISGEEFNKELGNEVQILELIQDKAFTFTIDRRKNLGTDMAMALFDSFVSADGHIAFVRPAYYNRIKLDKNFIHAGDKTLDSAIKGAVGINVNAEVIVVSTTYLPANTNYIITHPSVLVSPIKIADYHHNGNTQGINGWLTEGRLYYDAFVINKKKQAIYVSKAK